MLERILLTNQDLYITIIKKKYKGIFGSASNEEIRELKEEGIEMEVIPWIQDKSN